MRSFIVVLLTAKIGFICNDAVTSLKLLEKGFSKEDLALTVLLDFPLQIFLGYYAAKWSNGPQPLKPVSKGLDWYFLYANRDIVAVCILWTIGIGCCMHVDCSMVSTESRNRLILFLCHHGSYCIELLYGDCAICQYFSIHDKHCWSTHWWYIHDCKWRWQCVYVISVLIFLFSCSTHSAILVVHGPSFLFSKLWIRLLLLHALCLMLTVKVNIGDWWHPWIIY